MKNISQVEFERRVSAIILLPISEDAACLCVSVHAMNTDAYLLTLASSA